MIVGLTGPAGAGKSEAVKYLLEQRGFKQITLSDFVKKETKKRGLPMERSHFQEVGNDLRKQHGPGVMGKLARETIEQETETDWVVDGIRNPKEIEELKKLDDYITIAIVASMPILLDRLDTRGDAKDTGTREELEKKIMRELSGSDPIDGLRIDLCIESSDFVFENESTIQKLHENIEIALS